MEKGIRTCKVCGKDYPYCKTERPDGLYRWQDVACCPEHAAVYFAQIAESRGTKLPDEIVAILPKSPKKKSPEKTIAEDEPKSEPEDNE